MTSVTTTKQSHFTVPSGDSGLVHGQPHTTNSTLVDESPPSIGNVDTLSTVSDLTEHTDDVAHTEFNSTIRRSLRSTSSTNLHSTSKRQSRPRSLNRQYQSTSAIKTDTAKHAEQILDAALENLNSVDESSTTSSSHRKLVHPKTGQPVGRVEFKSTRSSIDSRSTRSRPLSASSTHVSKSRKSLRKSKAQPRRPISTKKLLKIYDQVEFENVEGSPETVILIQPDDSSAVRRYYITRKQQVLLLRKRAYDRLHRMDLAKSYANRISYFSAKYHDKLNGQSVVEYAANKVLSRIICWIYRCRFLKKRRAAIKIQRWYRSNISMWQQYKTQLKSLQDEESERIEMLNLQIMVQRHFRTYVQMVETLHLLRDKFAVPIQSFIRKLPYEEEYEMDRKKVISIQNGVRRLLVIPEYQQLLLDRVQFLKKDVLRLFEEKNAPYQKRALFCYSTRTYDKDTFSVCYKEWRQLMDRDEPFLQTDEYILHLKEIYEKLARDHHDDMSLVNIVNRMFKPHLNFQFKMSKDARKKKKMFAKKGKPGSKQERQAEEEQRNEELKSDPDSLAIQVPVDMHYVTSISHLPFEMILKELVKVMFSPNSSVDRANWSSVILFNYVLSMPYPEKGNKTE